MKKLIRKFNSIIFSFIIISIFAMVSETAYAYSLSNKTQISQTSLRVINDFIGVADYIHQYGKLPYNYITKSEAKHLGWTPGDNLWKFAEGKSIGGDIYHNVPNSLPKAPGRIWRQCDINYNGGPDRGKDKLLYSNDGFIYGTRDNYKTFICYYGKS